MKDQELLGCLLDLARRLDFEVRTDQGPFRDGDCRLHDRRVVILNRNSPPHRKIAALGRALSDCSLDDVFLLPAIRDVIEVARRRPSDSAPATDDLISDPKAPRIDPQPSPRSQNG